MDHPQLAQEITHMLSFIKVLTGNVDKNNATFKALSTLQFDSGKVYGYCCSNFGEIIKPSDHFINESNQFFHYDKQRLDMMGEALFFVSDNYEAKQEYFNHLKLAYS